MLNTITSYTKQCLVKECHLMSKHPQQFCDLEAHVGILESNPAEVTFESTQSGLVDTNILVLCQPNKLIILVHASPVPGVF